MLMLAGTVPTLIRPVLRMVSLPLVFEAISFTEYDPATVYV